MNNVTPSCLAFLKSLDRPQGRDSLSVSGGRETPHDLFWEMTCRRYGWSVYKEGRILLTPVGRAVLVGGVTPMTRARHAFFRSFDSPKGRRNLDISQDQQQITWTVEFQIEGWLDGTLSSSTLGDNVHLTSEGREALAATYPQSPLGSPVFLVNLPAGLLSGLWLAYLGEWKSIVLGLGLVLLSRLLTFVFMPGFFLFNGIATILFKLNWKTSGEFFLFLNSIYITFITVSWSFGILVFFQHRETPLAHISVLIWSYSVATVGLSLLAAKDGNLASAFNAAMIQVAYIGSIAGIVFLNPTWGEVAIFFCAIMCIPIGYGVMVVRRLEAAELLESRH